MDIFERGIREKVRFNTFNKGLCNMEDLYDIPLTSKNGTSLDKIAGGLYKEIQEAVGISFVGDNTPGNNLLELKLEIVKAVIKRKLQEREIKENALANKVRREKIMAILADKEDDSLKGKSPEELKAMLESL